MSGSPSTFGSLQVDQSLAGAKGDGRHLDTQSIQEALDECGAKDDGGVVELLGGKTYLSGHLKLPSKVTLRLLEGSTLQASLDVSLRSYVCYQLQQPGYVGMTIGSSDLLKWLIIIQAVLRTISKRVTFWNLFHHTWKWIS